MTIFKKELRSGAVSFLAWSAVIGGLMAVCVGMYPSMAGSMGLPVTLSSESFCQG